jgi:hypothetical protein
MNETSHIGDVSILVSRKAVKNVHLSVHPPSGRVILVTPDATRLEVARAYAISKRAGYASSNRNSRVRHVKRLASS